jgi:hypothetical protein
MKNLVYKIFILMIILPMVSCGDDILDLEPLNKEGSNIYYDSEENCLKALASCYRSNNKDYDLWCWGELSTDNVTKGGNGLQDGLWYYELANFSANSVNRQIVNMWKWIYETITRSNELINQIASQEEASELKNRYAAEARFLRAYSYFKLLMVYGRVPLLDKVLIPSDFENIRRAETEKEVIDFIKSDLDEVIPVLAEKGTVEPGHVTRGAAEALKARVIMYEIGYQFNDIMKSRAPELPGEDVNDLWQDVYDLTMSLINSDKYDLLSNFALLHERDGENSIETVFELQFITDLSIASNAHYPSNSLYARNGVRGLKGWGFNLPKDNLYAEFSRNGDVDPRRECSIISEDWPVGWGINVIDSIIMGSGRQQYEWNTQNPDYDYSIFKTRRKGTVSANEIPHWRGQDYNLRVIRYADVLLMNAEAAYYLGKEQEARDRVNAVRQRAANSTYPRGAFLGDVDENGIPINYRDFPDADLPIVTSSGTDLLEDIWHERRVELAFEDLRYFDLIRTGRIDQLANPDGYRSKMGLQPLPDNDVTSWGLEQNSGY